VAEDSGANSIDVLANDADYDPGDTKTIVAKTNGAHGTVTITGGGTGLTYTPAANYHGTDTFTYRINDGEVNSPTDATVHVTVTPRADTPSVTNATTYENTKSASGLVISRNAADDDTTTHFKITAITNGTLYQPNGAPITNNQFVTYAQGHAGLKFLPAAGLSSPSSSFSFKAQASTGAADSGLGGSLVTATITVTEGGTVKFNATAYSVGEARSTITINVTRSGGTAGATSVKYAASGGTASGYTSCAAGRDYITKTGTLSWAHGDKTNKTFTIPVCNDAVFEGNETVNLTLSNVTGSGSLGTPQSAVLTIVDSETQPQLSVNGVTVTEGNAGSVNAVFTVTLSGASSKPVTVKYQTANDTAAAPADYTAVGPTTLTFSPGQPLTKTVTVAVKGDLTDELDETFKVNLSAPTNATLLNGVGVGTIKDNDAAAISINNLSVTEPDAYTAAMTFTVKLSLASSRTVTVNYMTADGTAAAPADYTALASATLSFSPGQTTKTVTVRVKGELTAEPNETLFVNLSSPVNATISDAQGLGTILNDD
jgi:hypothetical protein